MVKCYLKPTAVQETSRKLRNLELHAKPSRRVWGNCLRSLCVLLEKIIMVSTIKGPGAPHHISCRISLRLPPTLHVCFSMLPLTAFAKTFKILSQEKTPLSVRIQKSLGLSVPAPLQTLEFPINSHILKLTFEPVTPGPF